MNPKAKRCVYIDVCVCVLDGGMHTAPCRLTFPPPPYSLASRSSLLGWRIRPRREMNECFSGQTAFSPPAAGGLLSGLICTQDTGHLIWQPWQHLTRPLAQGVQRGSWTTLTGSGVVSFWGLQFDCRRETHLWLILLVKRVVDSNEDSVGFLLTSRHLSTGSVFALVAWIVKTYWGLILLCDKKERQQPRFYWAA